MTMAPPNSKHKGKSKKSKKPSNIPQAISQDENTSLWITGLPAATTYHNLLASIRKIGAIKSTFINEPNKKYPTSCAAKVVFFEHEAAQKLYDNAQQGTFLVLGVQPVVKWNSFGVKNDPPNGRSRVLRIEGPIEVMYQAWFARVWRSTGMYWRIDDVLEIGPIRHGVGVVWYAFGSWASQAGKAKKILQDEFPGVFKVEYKDDPCA
ncbi:hypothetical protein SLS62_007423 [Diatrype stigma]|uniref:RRM domain-containing protein n=1 Tax=Diatrype stigma TaxID=117547 RepID=A0AAN9YNC8_9PEZI